MAGFFGAAFLAVVSFFAAGFAAAFFSTVSFLGAAAFLGAAFLPISWTVISVSLCLWPFLTL